MSSKKQTQRLHSNATDNAYTAMRPDGSPVRKATIAAIAIKAVVQQRGKRAQPRLETVLEGDKQTKDQYGRSTQ